MFYAMPLQISEVQNHIKCSHIILELPLFNLIKKKKSSQKIYFDVIHLVFI